MACVLCHLIFFNQTLLNLQTAAATFYILVIFFKAKDSKHALAPAFLL